MRKLVNIYILLMMMFQWLPSRGQEVWTLEQCLDTASMYNKSLQIDRNEIAIGREREEEARANLLPKLSLNTDYKYFIDLPRQLMPVAALNPQAPEGEFRAVQFGVPHNINGSLQVVIPIYNPQIYGGIEKTKIASRINDLKYQKTEEDLYFEISNLYYNAQILQHQIGFVDANIGNVERLLRNIELLHENKMVTGSEVSKVRLQLSQLNTRKAMLHSQNDQVLSVLKFMMGLSPERTFRVESEIGYDPEKQYEAEETIDLQLIRAQNQLLQSELVTLDKTRKFPSVHFIANYGLTGLGYDQKPHRFLDFYAVGFAGVQLSYPIFSGQINRIKRGQKQMELHINRLQTELLLEKNEMEIRNAGRRKNVALTSIGTIHAEIDLAQQIYDQELLLQREGTASLTEVLLADNELRQAQQNYLSAVVDYVKADLELKKLKGRMRN